MSNTVTNRKLIWQSMNKFAVKLLLDYPNHKEMIGELFEHLGLKMKHEAHREEMKDKWPNHKTFEKSFEHK